MKKEEDDDVKDETDDDDVKGVKVEPKLEDADAEQRVVRAEVFINAAGVIVEEAALGPRAMVGAPPKADGAGDDVLEMEEIMRRAHENHLADGSAKRGSSMKRPSAAPAAHSVAAVVRRLRLRRIRGKQRGPVAYYGLKADEMDEKAKSLNNLHTYQTWAYQKVRKALERAGYNDETARDNARWWHSEVKATWEKVRGK